MGRNPYDVLGLPRDASEEAVRKQYALVLAEVRRRLKAGRKIDPRKLDAFRAAFKELTEPIDDTGTYARPHAMAQLAPPPGDTVWIQGAPAAAAPRKRRSVAWLVAIVIVAAILLTVAYTALAFDLQGHRGARGLAPENTLAAFEQALRIGVTTLETDLAVTKDGVLVISHDPVLNPDLVRGPDGKWLPSKGPPIHSLTLAELSRYDIGRINPASDYAKTFSAQRPVDGQKYPTFAQVLALGAGRPVRFNVETKITPTSGEETPDPDTFARLVVAAIRSAGLAGRVTVQSFDWRTLVAVKKVAPEIATVCLTIESQNMDTVQRAAGASPWHAGLSLADHGRSLPRLVKSAGCGTWSMFFRNLTPDQVAEAHALGLAVMPWTVNDPADMARLVDWKVDGLITDYPDRARKVMADKGIGLPPGVGN